jgi:hypothetical protein
VVEEVLYRLPGEPRGFAGEPHPQASCDVLVEQRPVAADVEFVATIVRDQPTFSTNWTMNTAGPDAQFMPFSG